MPTFLTPGAPSLRPVPEDQSGDPAGPSGARRSSAEESGEDPSPALLPSTWVHQVPERDGQQPQKEKTRRQPGGATITVSGQDTAPSPSGLNGGPGGGGEGQSHAGQEAASHRLPLPERPPRATPPTPQALREDVLFLLTNEGQSSSGGEPGQPDF